MKKILTILLLIGFVIQMPGGYHIFFQLKLANIKRTNREKIESQVLEENSENFIFSLADANRLLVWEEDHEFRYQGEMYDVIEKKIVNGVIYIKCISDKKETELVKNYRKLAKDDFGSSAKKRSRLLLKFMSVLYTPLVNSISTQNMIKTGKASWYTYQNRLLFNPKEVITPPPQVS